mgnify:CR=1 FL=1
MQIEILEETIEETKRFLIKALRARSRLISSGKMYWRSIEVANAKRSSLDLSRKLAEMRRR